MHVICDNQYKTGADGGNILGQPRLFECIGTCVLSPAHESEMRGYSTCIKKKKKKKEKNKQRSILRHFQDIVESDDTHDAKINVHSDGTPTLISGSTCMLPMSTPAGQNYVRSSDSGKESDVENRLLLLMT